MKLPVHAITDALICSNEHSNVKMIPFLLENEETSEAILTFLSTLSVCSSLLATVILQKCRKIPISIKFVVFNTALMDILKGIILITYIHTDASQHCIVQDHFLYVLHVSTVIQVAFMGPDRVINIYRPMFYQKFFTKRSILVLCVFTWGVALVLSAFGCLLKGSDQLCRISTESDQIPIAVPLATVLVVSVLISTVSGFLLFYKVWSVKHHTTGHRGEVRSYKGHIVIAIMQICILVLATPCAVCLVLLSLDKEARMILDFPIKEAIRISAVCFTMSGVLIPPVYVFRLTECRIRLLEILCFWHPFLKQKAIIMDIQFRMDMVGIPITRDGQISAIR